jgi:hypothetical protein
MQCPNIITTIADDSMAFFKPSGARIHPTRVREGLSEILGRWRVALRWDS